VFLIMASREREREREREGPTNNQDRRAKGVSNEWTTGEVEERFSRVLGAFPPN
jgi:hypothetical protein